MNAPGLGGFGHQGTSSIPIHSFALHALEDATVACQSSLTHPNPGRARKENDFYTHRLDKLLNISGVKDALENRAAADPGFLVNWNAVRDWNETSRYEHATSEAKARDMLIAVTDSTSGVLTWLRTQW